MTTTATYEEPIFASAYAALKFAFNYSTEQYAPTPMAKLGGGSGLGSGKGLVGLDGAGQAGMILAEVRNLGIIDSETYVSDEAPEFLAGRYAPQDLVCGCSNLCCKGVRPSGVWLNATVVIAESASHVEAGEEANYRLRHGLVRRFFGARVNMTELAKHAQVSRDAASQTYAGLLPWLRREQGRAEHAILSRFKERGFIQ